MKKIRCPKCDELVAFDESRYESGRILVFECPACHKQFKLKLKEPVSQDASPTTDKLPDVLGQFIVLEIVFHLKQIIPLRAGENVIGRHVPGTKANAAFKTVDPSVDTTHCIITARIDRITGRPDFILRDAPSNTGTFLMNEILPDKARVQINDGAVITIGATTMILQC